MKSPVLLAYHLSEQNLAQYRRLCLRLRIRFVPVAAEQLACPISALLRLPGAPETSNDDTTFSEPMLLLAFFPDALLSAFLDTCRKDQLPPVPLKAVLTDKNRDWSGAALGKELQKEAQAIAERAHTKNSQT